MNFDIETFIISYLPVFVFPIIAIPFLIVAKIFKGSLKNKLFYITLSILLLYTFLFITALYKMGYDTIAPYYETSFTERFLYGLSGISIYFFSYYNYLAIIAIIALVIIYRIKKDKTVLKKTLISILILGTILLSGLGAFVAPLFSTWDLFTPENKEYNIEKEFQKYKSAADITIFYPLKGLYSELASLDFNVYYDLSNNSSQNKELLETGKKYFLQSVDKSSNYYRLMNFYIKIKEYDEALNCTEKIKFKDKSQKWQWQANIFVQKREYNKAIECAIREKEGNTKFFHLTDAYIGLNDLDKAQEYSEKISNKSTSAYFRRKLLILEKKGDIQQAKKEYEKCRYSKDKTYDEFLFAYRESFSK